MKKLLLLMILVSALSFAKDSPTDILEDRIEDQLKVRMASVIKKADYDVTIVNNSMNIEVEIEGLTTPKMNFDRVAQEILKNLGTDNSIDDIYIVIKHDSTVGEDKILFSQYFKK
ncbi:hypothetical protein OQE61_11860 [Cetobacterium somerae]|uniref:hypothetical protein n=1 Tax=Cetobacterium somerae TaxID=188913 RepID=UPI001F05E26D|nr:hypothetical protein [Cetobacterium somerae]MCX3068194.1 hypothetical protein [Cetobacterium somerae]UPO97380.1 hypothetical protein MKD34_00670 [Cetobacterium somerae]